MIKLIKKVAAILILSGIAVLPSTAMAQSAEEIVNIGLDVQIGQPAPEIRRLDDIRFSYEVNLSSTGVPTGTANSPEQYFCLHAPGTDEFTLETIGTNIFEHDNELLALTEGQTGQLNQLSYRLRIVKRDTNSRTGFETVSFTSDRVDVVSLAVDDLINNEEDCGGNDNMFMRIEMSIRHQNSETISSLPSGENYQFSDQITMIITPSI